MDNRVGDYINYYTNKVVQTTGWGTTVGDYDFTRAYRCRGYVATVKIDVYNSQLVTALLR